MKYLVVLADDTAAGHVHSANAVGHISIGGANYPALACTEVTVDGAHYRVRFMKTAGMNNWQKIYLPQSAVVTIIRYDEDGPPPLGFVAFK